jgi:hypothetical protein
MIKVLILSLIILILVYIIFQYDLIKIPNIESFENKCFVKNQGNLDVNMTQCKIYYVDNRDTCDSYPELYKLTILQLDILLTLSGGNSYVQYNGKNYDIALINNVKEDKLKNNIKDGCGFTPEGLYEIESSIAFDGTINNFTYEGKRQYGCFLPLETSDINGGNIKDTVINKYGNVNKACIDDTNKTPVTNINCVGTSCPETNDFHVITNFDNIENTYTNNMVNGDIFLKIYDRSSVSFVKYNKQGNKLITIPNNSSDVKNRFDNLYEIQYINPTPNTSKYPRYAITDNKTIYSDGTTFNVMASSGENVYKIFDNDKTSIGWNTTSTRITEYISGYPGEFLKFDLGENIVLKNFTLHPNTDNINKSPKNFRIYATNNDSSYNNLKKSDIIITENGVTNKDPKIITNTEYNYYDFKNISTNNSIKFLQDTECDILIVGGGGAGTTGNGGGSSGGVLYYKNVIMAADTYTITVGSGGKSSGANGTSSKIINSRSVKYGEAVGGNASTTASGASGSGTNSLLPSGITGTLLNNEIAKAGGSDINSIEYTISNIQAIGATATQVFTNISKVKGYGGRGIVDGTRAKNQTEDTCREYALSNKERYKAWGYRNASHPADHYKTTCFFYTNSFTGYNGNNNDNVHTTGCLNPGERVESGCVTSSSSTTVDENSKYYYYAFRNIGNNNSITFLQNTVCDVLVVGGGGGGGGRHGAGGGAGGLIYVTGKNISSGTYNITVGRGGKGGTPNVSGKNGGNSSVFGLEAIGGGGGAYWQSAPTNGGSGGGGVRSGGNGINGQGNNGGNGVNGGNPYNWGGGGGAGEAGGNGTTNGSGKGGNGREINITGTAIFYAGGGGGGSHNPAGSRGLGGLGGGGAGGVPGRNNPGVNGTNGLGGGGGGASTNWSGNSSGGDGGSGIVIIRVMITSAIISSGGGGGTQGNGLVPTNTSRPDGGNGIVIDITGANQGYAGGGGGFNKNPSLNGYSPSNSTYGNGGNSLLSSFGNGNNGIVIIRWRKSVNNMTGWSKIYEHSPGSVAPVTFYNRTLTNTTSYRYYAMVIKDNWITGGNAPGCSISELELYGYEQTVGTTINIEPPAIYATPTSTTKEAYLFIFDNNNKIKEVDKNNIANFSLKDNFKIGTNDISDKLLNSANNTPAYGKISRTISQYINSKNNDNMTLNLSEIDAKIVEYNADSANLGTNIPTSLSRHKQAIFNDINITGLTFEKYDDYSRLYNGKFYMSNDDNIYIKL